MPKPEREKAHLYLRRAARKVDSRLQEKGQRGTRGGKEKAVTPPPIAQRGGFGVKHRKSRFSASRKGRRLVLEIEKRRKEVLDKTTTYADRPGPPAAKRTPINP